MSNPKKQVRGLAIYNIALQKAIEAHCRGEQITGSLYDQCPHHAEMLNNNLLTTNELELLGIALHAQYNSVIEPVLKVCREQRDGAAIDYWEMQARILNDLLNKLNDLKEKSSAKE